MRRGLVRAFVLLWVCGNAAAVGGQTSRPAVVPRIAALELAGDWYEAATSGSFALRRCLSDTRHSLVRRSERTFEVRTACMTNRGVERRRRRAGRTVAADALKRSGAQFTDRALREAITARKSVSVWEQAEQGAML